MQKESDKKKLGMVSLEDINKLSKSISKITCVNGPEKKKGTGFFMSIKVSNKVLMNCLLTNFHIIDYSTSNIIILQIGDNVKEYNITIKKNRITKYFIKPLDITMIEILDTDEFIKDINFLSYDLHYTNEGYEYYVNKEVFVLHHPGGKKMNLSMGKLISIDKDSVSFEHDAVTDKGSSGSAIILNENNCVIGIHKSKKKNTEINKGTFIGKLFEGIVIDTKLKKRIDNIRNEINLENNNNNQIEDDEFQNNNENLQSLLEEDKKSNENNILNNKDEKQKNNNILTLKYLIQKDKCNVILFSKKFIKNNKNKLCIYINNEKFEPCYQLDIRKIKVINNILDVKLKILEEIKYLENMFNSSDLMSISGFSGLDNKNINSIWSMFENCKSLNYIEDIDYLNTSNIEKFNHIFFNCISLESLPDISKWDTKNATHINHMFHGCKNLKSLPDISKWNTGNVIDMRHLFSGCISLLSIPDISKWVAPNLKKIGHLFSNCESIVSIPYIQKWSVENVTDMNSIFDGCKSLKSLPDISKWKTNNVKNMNGLFKGCKEVEELPDISNWKTKNVEKIHKLSYGCKKIKKNTNTKFWKKNHINNNKNFKNKDYDYDD